MKNYWDRGPELRGERRHHNFVQKVSDLDKFADTEQAVLVQDSQDVEAILEHLGDFENPGWGCLFVIVDNGDYLSVWGCESYVPYLHARLERLK